MKQPGCCSPVLEMHLQALHKQMSVFGPGGAGGRVEERRRVLGREGGEAGSRAGKVSPRFSAGDRLLLGNEGPTAAWSEIQLAAAVCRS